MSRDKQPHFFDQVMEAFGGYSPSGRIRSTDDGLVFEIAREAAVRSGVADPDAVVAGLNASALSGGIVKVMLVDRAD